MTRVVVVGAGISGLATAVGLSQTPGVEVEVLEAAPSAGGNVQTDIVDGRVIDRAANGWLDDQPAMLRLLERVGLLDQVVPASPTAAGLRQVWADGRLHSVPSGPLSLLRSPLLPWSGRLRLLLELFVGRGPATRDGDETVMDFAVRRLGQHAAERLVAPMCAGIYAADPAGLSLRSAFPRMVELERAHRSLIFAAIRLGRGGAPRGHLHSLPGGVGQLTDTLAAALGPALRCGVSALGIERRRDAWRVHTGGGTFDADGVVLACPAPVQAALVRGIDGDAASALAEIPYAPVAVVVTAAPRDHWERPPEGFGVLVARHSRDADLGVLGTVFTSNLFPSQSRPDEHLLRTIVGGAVDPSAAGLGDQELQHRVRVALQRFLGPDQGPPSMVRIYRHPQGIPQYAPEHHRRVLRVRAAQVRHPGLVFTGNHLDGVAVKDCARAAEAATASVLRELRIDAV
jgi:protoporphyrinogen/coproporphyrinogen III oxidase